MFNIAHSIFKTSKPHNIIKRVLCSTNKELGNIERAVARAAARALIGEVFGLEPTNISVYEKSPLHYVGISSDILKDETTKFSEHEYKHNPQKLHHFLIMHAGSRAVEIIHAMDNPDTTEDHTKALELALLIRKEAIASYAVLPHKPIIEKYRTIFDNPQEGVSYAVGRATHIITANYKAYQSLKQYVHIHGKINNESIKKILQPFSHELFIPNDALEEEQTRLNPFLFGDLAYTFEKNSDDNLSNQDYIDSINELEKSSNIKDKIAQLFNVKPDLIMCFNLLRYIGDDIDSEYIDPMQDVPQALWLKINGVDDKKIKQIQDILNANKISYSGYYNYETASISIRSLAAIYKFYALANRQSVIDITPVHSTPACV